jgi:hypothetical protein
MFACGGTRTSANPHVRSSAKTSVEGPTVALPKLRLPAGYDRDGDRDGSGDGPYDSDDKTYLDYGHAASRPVATAITTLVHRYYADIAANDGVGACSLIDKSIVSEFAPTSGTTDRGDGGCASALTSLFGHAFDRTSAELLAIDVTAVRVQADRALALLLLPTSEVRLMPLEREAGAWRLNGLLDVAVG